MIEFTRFNLPNGLRVLVNHDPLTPVVTLNLLYKVGSRDEDPNRTGFAHLFEHLMFGGSVNIPRYDEPLERAGGENNAFTTADFTNYYLSLPLENIETGFWLESDRMLSLAFSQTSLDVQKNVVVEEFNQRYLNQPYGDVWHLLRPLAYKIHPYQWPVMGKEPRHIEEASLDDVKEFFFHHYAPNNAILCVSGNVDIELIKDLAEKWFGPIPKRAVKAKNIPHEPLQTEARSIEVSRSVPYDSIYIAFPMCNRMHPDSPTTDLISDILSSGKSARLYQKLVKQKKFFSEIDAFISGEVDEGLLIITGQLSEGVSFERANESINQELLKIVEKGVDDYELEKVKNKFESTFLFGLTSPLEKAFTLCYKEMLGDANLLNEVVSKYRAVTKADIQRVAGELFQSQKSSTLFYKANR